MTAPGRKRLDLFSAGAVAAAVVEADAILHLATRIPPPEHRPDPSAWSENDRLRRDASRLLVDAALAANVETYVQPSVTFVYPADVEADEDTPLEEVVPILRSALAAEAEAARFAASGRRGVVLRLGGLDGPGTGLGAPAAELGATLHVEDAGAALVVALGLPSGTYNVCRDGERVSNARFKAASGWRPLR